MKDQEQKHQGKTENGQQQVQEPTTTRIEEGIEWFPVEHPDGHPDEDCQCARCGSSCSFVRCCNCDSDGEVYHDPWDGCGDGYYVTCDWCRGRSGYYHCISGPEWCNAHPMPGREHIESTALKPGEWDDA